MQQRWRVITFGVVGLMMGGLPVAQAQEATQTIDVPAPPSEASAAAVQVENVLTVGETAATSAQEGGTADANALGLGSNTLVEGSTGGSQDGAGTQSGALVELDEGPGEAGDVDVEVTPFDLAVDETSADSRAALARVFLGDVANVSVLHSESHTTYSPGTSTGRSFSDGVHACVAGACEGENADGLELVILHSEAESSGEGGSYVLRLGETTVLDDDDLGEAEDACSVTLGEESAEPLLLELLCVQATGGEGERAATGLEATVANTAILGDTLGAAVVAAAGSGGDAPVTPAPIDLPPRVAPVTAAVVETPAALPPAESTGVLAATGGSLLAALLAGIGLLIGGAALMAPRRRAAAGRV